MPSDTISESFIFQIFLGACPQTPLAIDLVLFNQIHINCFAMCMLSWNSRSNKPLKVPLDSISEGLIFKIFWDMPQDPLNLALFNQIYIIVLWQCACSLEISSRSKKPSKVPSDSILEGIIFQNFLGGHAPRPP